MSPAQTKKSALLGAGIVRPEVFSFHDYREYLKAWFEFQKNQDKSFSMRRLSLEIGIATSYFPMVLAGLRHLSNKAAHKLLPKLGISDRELTYFELLLTMGTTDSQQVRLATLDRMKRLANLVKANAPDLNAYEYLSHWYFVAIREMATIQGFQPDPKWIRDRLRHKISISEAKHALDFLTTNGFLKVLADGSIHADDKALECVSGIYRIGLKEFHRQMLTLVNESIVETPSEERQVLGHTLVLAPEQYDQATEIMTEALKKIAALGVPSEKQKTVYHLELALIPLTHPTKKGNENV